MTELAPAPCAAEYGRQRFEAAWELQRRDSIAECNEKWALGRRLERRLFFAGRVPCRGAGTGLQSPGGHDPLWLGQDPYSLNSAGQDMSISLVETSIRQGCGN